MATYHINDDGETKPCSAQTPEKCQFNDNGGHHDNLEDAQSAAEEFSRQAEENNESGTLTKTQSPQDDDDTSTALDDMDTDYADVNPKERSDQIQQDLDDAVSKIVNNGEFSRYLDAQARNGMTKWSWNNQITAAMQLEAYRRKRGYEKRGVLDTMKEMDACGAKQWGERDRKVTSGKGSGLYILAPQIKKKDVTDANGDYVRDDQGNVKKREQLVGYRNVAVFDVTQTGGEPVPQNPVQLKENTQELNQEHVDDMKNQISNHGYSFREENLSDTDDPNKKHYGSTSPTNKSVVVNSNLSEAEKHATIAHELSHIQLGHVDDSSDYQQHRGQRETEAEALSYMLMRRGGVDKQDSEAFSPGYIAHWSQGSMSTVRESLNKVSKHFGKMTENW